MVRPREPVSPVRDRFGLLLALLVSSLVLTAFDGRLAYVAVALVNAGVLLIAFRAVGLARSAPSMLLLAVLGAIGWLAAAAVDPDEVTGGIVWAIQAVILAAVALVVLRRVFQHERITLQTVAGALCLYVLVGLVFGMVYGGIEAVTDAVVLESGDRVAEDPIYYSFVTLTTVGFGDVISTFDVVRRITIVEAVVGQIFLATLVARLVSLYGTSRVTAPAAPGPSDE